MHDIEIRPATNEDAIEVWGKMPPKSFLGWSVVHNKKVAGIAGVTIEKTGRVCFSDIVCSDDLPKVTVFKTIKKVMALLASVTEVMYAAPDETKPNAEKLLQLLGFYDTNKVVNGHKLYVWRKS